MAKSRKRQYQCLLCLQYYKSYNRVRLPVCPLCKTILKEKYIDNRASGSRGSTVLNSYLELLQAIREQAVEDHRLEDWESYWVRSALMQTIWKEVSKCEAMHAQCSTDFTFDDDS